MSNIDIRALREAAEKAISEEGETWWNEEQLASDYGLALHRTDAKFIVASSPAAVLALLDELEAKDAELQEYLKAGAPVVPDEQNWEDLCQQNPEMPIADAIIRAASWNACRAAMLQSFGNSEQLNSPVIPDGWVACSERMPGDLEQVYLFTNGVVLKDAIYDADEQLFYWEYSADTCKASDASHWMPMIMPAAPQQEA